VIERLVIFGGTGDLAGRFLLPGLAALQAAGELPEAFRLLAAGRADWGEERYRRWAADWLGREAPDVGEEAIRDVLGSTGYRRLDLGDPDDVAACLEGEGPVVVYLALPPGIFPDAVRALGEAGLPPESQVVLEKPFGEDLETARELNRLLAAVVDERHVFRVDHFLAMTTVQNVLGTRLANRVLEPIWNSAHVEEVAVVWEESLALEGRAGYYDRTGALKDMIQNHLLQLLCLVAMEPPIGLGEEDLRNRKVDVLRSVRPFEEGDVEELTRRARYRAGKTGDAEVPDYVDEEGVEAERGTETFAEVELRLDGWRWSGTPFRLRTGKAMGADRKEVIVRFRPTPSMPFADPGASGPNRLRFGLEPEGVTLELTGTGPGGGSNLVPLTLSADMDPPDLPAYGRILRDVLRGDATLSIRADEAEEAWRILTPVLEAWADDRVPLEEYVAGSAPASRLKR
jgi:glucose-6-phosphate 1-dehydrogenase